MIELRWIVPEGTRAQAPRLQYRQVVPVWKDGHRVEQWSEWTDVPTVGVPAEPKNDTPLAHTAAGLTPYDRVRLGLNPYPKQTAYPGPARLPTGVKP